MAAGLSTSVLNTTTLSEMVSLVRTEWLYKQTTIKRVAKALFINSPIGMGEGNSKKFTEVDIETYASFKAEGGNSSKAQAGVGYNKTGNVRTFSKEIDITLEMRQDNRYNEVAAYITNLSEFCANKQDLDLTHRFTFATSTSYTDMDGETVDVSMGDTYALCYSAHTLAFSSTTYRNRVSGDPAFSQGGLEAALALTVTDIYSNFGEKRTMNFNTIISGDDPSTIREIRSVLESTANVDAVQAGITNVYRSRLNHVVLPNLATTAAGAVDSTKRRWWFIAAIDGMNGWQAYVGDKMAPTLYTPNQGGNGEDIHTFNWTFATVCRYMIVIPSGKGIISSCPTS